MPEDAAKRPVVIFLSYRRGDTQWAARGIYDKLASRYGQQNVFRDLDTIPPGVRFRDYVEKKISESHVFILLIGKAWAAYEDEAGRRRLELPRDPVRLEIESALRLGIPIIPVRVEGAPMPTGDDLVPSLLDLLEFNAAEVSDSRWEYDVDRLLRAINETVGRSVEASRPQPADELIPPVIWPETLEARPPQNRVAPVHRGGAEPIQMPHGAAVRAIAFSPEGARLATASRDATVRIAEVATGREIARLPHQAGVFGVAFCPKGTRLAAASSNMALLWDLRTNLRLRWFLHDDRVWGVVFSPDGTRLITASHDHSARIWDASNGQELVRLLHDAPVAGVACSPDGARVATASDDKTASIWDAFTGVRLMRMAHEGAVGGVAFSPDGRKLATAGSDSTARIWAAANGVKLTEVKHDGPVHAVAFTSTGSRLATAGQDQTARVWDPIRGSELRRLPHDGRVWAVAFSPDESRLATASHDRLARIWKL
jgi:dipeptidyl aminopeptidase/acylaminoacyl peptidase